jgi:hypothetical protein
MRRAIVVTVLAFGLLSAPAQAEVKKGSFRTSLTLDGLQGVRLTVKPLRVLDPVQLGQFDQPKSGRRVVGIRVRIRNRGGEAYSDAPGNGARLVTRSGKRVKARITVTGNCRTDSSLRVAPGKAKTVCITFEVPQGQRARSFRWTPNSGFGDDTGEWRLP